MSSENQSSVYPTATGTMESALYGAERTKQGVSQTQAAAQPYTDQAKSYVSTAQDNIAAATTSQSTDRTSAPTYVEQAKGLAAGAAATATSTAQSVVAVAQEKLSGATQQTSTAANDFQARAGAHTDAAALQGQQDVDKVKTTATGYVEQAKSLAGSALAGAQSYVVAGQERLDTYHAQNPPNEGTTVGSITSTLHSTASTALETTKQYLASAHSSLQPQSDYARARVDSAAASAQGKASAVVGYGTAAKEAIQPSVDDTKVAVQPHIQAAQGTIQPHIDAVQQATQPHVDSMHTTVQSRVDAAKEAASSTYSNSTSS